MSKQTDSFRAVQVFNPHEFYNDDKPTGQVYISWTGSGGRSPIGYHWTVFRRGYKTQPKGGAWYEYGNKTFSAYGGGEAKKKALAEAQAWAGTRYGITEWARDPYGSYGDAGFVRARVKELKEKLREEAQQ